ncbi:hypothetical protein [Pectobacterium versatile]|nr:hypothetical protein [Pectobacterium versatile]
MSIDILTQGRNGSRGANGQNGMPVRSATGGMRGAVSLVHTGE